MSSKGSGADVLRKLVGGTEYAMRASSSSEGKGAATGPYAVPLKRKTMGRSRSNKSICTNRNSSSGTPSPSKSSKIPKAQSANNVSTVFVSTSISYTIMADLPDMDQ